jgi:hypothetical protein
MTCIKVCPSIKTPDPVKAQATVVDGSFAWKEAGLLEMTNEVNRSARMTTNDIGVRAGKWKSCPRPSLVPQEFCKIFHIFRHIESLDVCMKH